MIQNTLLIAVTTAASFMVQPVMAQDLPEPLEDQDYLYNGEPSRAIVKLGQALFFDPVLSGNRNISCGTCHDPAKGSGDGVALSIGEGGSGSGALRKTSSSGVTGRVPRNAQPLYNVGAREYTSFFHDGRLQFDSNRTFKSGFWSPAREHLPAGLDNLLAAQAMFPVLSAIEMAGQKGENQIATAVAEDRLNDAWELLARRLSSIPGYRTLFESAFGPGQISFVQAANAIAAFQTVAFRSNSSPFGKFLADKNGSHLNAKALAGMSLFFGSAGCANCHSGALLTDHKFHAIAMPQIGPGKGHGRDSSYWRASGFMDRLEDEGRYRVTFRQEDLFAFRTPSLLNVALTGPWGHSGSFNSLEDVVLHHLDPVTSLDSYNPDSLTLPELDTVIEQTAFESNLIYRPLNPARIDEFMLRDTWVQHSEHLRARIGNANALPATSLTREEVSNLVAFLHALTDPNAISPGNLIPETVPSGLSPQPSPTLGDLNE